MSKAHSRTFYRPELDTLRFVAFLLVFVHHAFPAPVGSALSQRVLRAIGEGSAFGVSLFFLLSAYLITELLLRERDGTGNVNLKNFYIRRVLRIWPLYFAVLGLAALAGHFVPSLHIPLGGLLAYLLLSGNWWSSLHGFLPFTAGPLWSISIEEQFYLLWPVLVRQVSKRAVLQLGIAIWLLSQLFLFLFTHFRHVTPDEVWLNSFVEFQYFALGIILASILGGRRLHMRAWARVLLGCAGVVLMIAPELQYDALGHLGVVSTRDVLHTYPFAGFGSLCLFCSFLGSAAPGWTRAFQYLGRISYGLYVFHLTVIYGVLAILGRLHIQHLRILFIFGVALPLTIGLAHLSYRYFEVPFLRIKRRFEIIKTAAS